jgi:hypothetical protein
MTPPHSLAEDRIASVCLSSCYLPLATPISDAKVLTGRQKPMTEIAMLFAEVKTANGHEGLGFSYAKRAGGPGQFAHAREIDRKSTRLNSSHNSESRMPSSA